MRELLSLGYPVIVHQLVVTGYYLWVMLSLDVWLVIDGKCLWVTLCVSGNERLSSIFLDLWEGRRQPAYVSDNPWVPAADGQQVLYFQDTASAYG